MKKLILILVALVALVGSVNAEVKSKGIRHTNYGYNEFYEITLKGHDSPITYFVPHYDYIEARYPNDKSLAMLSTLYMQVKSLTMEAEMNCVAQYSPNPALDKDVARLTKDKYITVGLVPGGYIVINLYYDDTNTFGTFVYY